MDIKVLVLVTTLIFLIAPAFIILFVFVYNQRKKSHIEEKALMRVTFEAELTKTQLEVQEQTMQTIGADLHDNIGQLLSLTSLTLNSIELDNVERSRQKIDAAIDLTMRSIKEMRLLGKLLQGDQLIVIGLSEAIKHEINWLERSGKYIIDYVLEGDLPAVNNSDKDLILFRILQEVLNNIIKHAEATQINLKMEYADNLLRLQIDDNGVGFNAAILPVNKLGMGLQNMNKRAAIVNGQVQVNSQPNKGTCIIISIPYP
ncbi:sensor histidine kinase [Mucilaginibacter gracilis]|nr:ATP-binding protein [Mucilaginibacter gracilis]